MRKHTDSVARLINCFTRLPGVGLKTAERYAYAVIKMTDGDAQGFARALLDARESTFFCGICGGFTDKTPCRICAARDKTLVCVVAEPNDILAMEKMDGYTGTYHVLGGVISPMEGRGPDALRIKELVRRVREDGVREVIMATNPDAEGEVTAIYAANLLKPLGVKVSRIAQGISIGSSIEYADGVTLTRAFEGRSPL